MSDDVEMMSGGLEEILDRLSHDQVHERQKEDEPYEYAKRVRFEVDGLDNSVLDAFQKNVEAPPPGQFGYMFDNSDVSIITEDAIVFQSRHTFQQSVTIKESDHHDAQSRLYVLMEYALGNPPLELGKFEIMLSDVRNNFGASELRRAKDHRNWQILVTQYERNSHAVSALFMATTKVTLENGDEGDRERRLIDLVRHAHPEYYIAWLIAHEMNIKGALISKSETRIDKGDKGDIYDTKRVGIWDMMTQDAFGLNGPGVVATVELNRRNFTGTKAQMLVYVLDRLNQYKTWLDERERPQTLFSTIASTIKQYFVVQTIDVQLNAQQNGYGNFHDRSAMMAFLLAVNELSIIKSCSSMVKTLILQMNGVNGIEAKLLSVCGVMLGYNIETVMMAPMKAEHAPIVYSRISVESLGSLAAVWLSTQPRYTYEELLTAGLEQTAPFVGYARVVPFVQAVIMYCARQEGVKAKALITVANVVYVFKQIALVMVQTTPGFSDIGTSKLLTEIDQQIVTTLFYGAMASGSWMTDRESTYLAQLVHPLEERNVQSAGTEFDLTDLNEPLAL